MWVQRFLLVCYFTLAPTLACADNDFDSVSDVNSVSYDDAAKPTIVNNIVLLQALDKVTARVKTIEAKVGKTITFGTLNITVERCLKTPPEDPPEAVAFLEIQDNNPAVTPRILFQGWMFASNPSISALEHPVYDVWIKDCQNPEKIDYSDPLYRNNTGTVSQDTHLNHPVAVESQKKPATDIEEIEDNPPIVTTDQPHEQAQQQIEALHRGLNDE